MPRFLVLVFFLATCCIAFMSGNLFAGESDTSLQKAKSPKEGLASLLKSTHKKSSADTKLSSNKKTSKLKSAYHKTKGSSKFAHGKKTLKKTAYAGKHHKKFKHSLGKAKHYKKTQKHKTKTANRSF
jgi:hypothetical protein